MTQAILLIGSPRGKSSTSFALGKYLTDKLAEAGWQISTELIYASRKNEHGLAELALGCDNADLLILAFPLYADHLPGPVIETILALGDHRRQQSAKLQKLMCIVNCGFPEAHQNDPAVSIMENFAVSNGYTWLGGLTLGMGGAVSGRDLTELGSRTHNVVKALDLAANDIISGNQISVAALATMRKPIIPRWLYLMIADSSWKKYSKLSKKELCARPNLENVELTS